MKVLLVDDEKELTKSLSKILNLNGFDVDVCNDPLDALNYIKTYEYDALVLDIMMPKLDGFTLLKTIRDSSNFTPVLFLTAKSDIDDKLKGFSLGCDDYLPKPFNSKELVARLNVIIKRNGKSYGNCLSFEDVKLDETSFELQYKDKKAPLVNKEYKIVELLFLNPNKIFSAEEMMNKLWSYDTDSDISTVWSFIFNIRKKLVEINAPIVLKLYRGLGYKFIKKDV